MQKAKKHKLEKVLDNEEKDQMLYSTLQEEQKRILTQNNSLYNQLPTKLMHNSSNQQIQQQVFQVPQQKKRQTNRQNTQNNNELEIENKENSLNSDKIRVHNSSQNLKRHQQSNSLSSSTRKSDECIPSIIKKFKQSQICLNETESQKVARIKINKDYSLDIIKNLKAIPMPQNFLKNHQVPQLLRAKMVDWLIEVVKSYKFAEETYFMAIQIMDDFFHKSKKIKQIQDMHIIGVTCVLIASKYEEIFPIKLQVLQEKIAHNKMTAEQIKEIEAEILNCLNFRIMRYSPYTLSIQILSYLNYQEKLSTKMFAYCQQMILYLFKMVLYQYDIMKNANIVNISCSVVYIVFQVISQIDSSFDAHQNIKLFSNILQVQTKDYFNCLINILNLIKNFNEIFPNLPNLKKFHEFENQQFTYEVIENIRIA